MTIDGDAMMQAVTDAPEDDAPRLAYADWLDEHGDPDRAEFIRVQIELAKLPKVDDGPETAIRRLELIERLPSPWKQPRRFLGPLGKRGGPLRGRAGFVHFERGFPYRAFLSVERLLESGVRLFQMAPIRELSLSKVSTSDVERLERSPWLTHVTELSLGPIAGESPPLGRLACSPHLTHLCKLDLGSIPFADGAITELLSSQHLPRLTGLSLSWGLLGDLELRRLAFCPRLTHLKELSLCSVKVGPAGIRALATAPPMATLERLALHGAPLDVEAAVALTRSAFFPRLASLLLTPDYLDPGAAEALMAGPATAVRSLWLGRCHVRDAVARALARSTSLTGLTELAVIDNAIGPAGAAALLSSPVVQNLVDLNLASNPIGDEGAEALAASPHMAKLVKLNLPYCGIGAAGARALARSPYLGNLRRIGLGGKGLGQPVRALLRERFGKAIRF